MSGRLKGKVAIVTGGSTGIGEAISKKFALEGASVIVNGLPSDPIEEVVKDIVDDGGKAAGYSGDVSEEQHASSCIQKALDEFGKLDILINNAGTFKVTGETDKFPVEAFLDMQRSNVQTVFMMTKLALPHLQKSKGVVISAGSEAGELGQPECTVYGGTKAWIHSFMKGVALEQAQYGVRANCVSPGPIKTEWHDTDVSAMTKEMEEDIIKAAPMGRHGTPEEAANVYAFLASDEASFVTGALYFVDGGMMISRGPVGSKVPDELRKPPEGKLKLRFSETGLKNKETKRVE